MLLRGVLALALISCSSPSGITRTDLPAGQAGESGAPSEPTAGTGGTGGSEPDAGPDSGNPDLCQAGDERLCSCAPGYGGKQTCSDFGWNICRCPDWPPDGGAGTGGGGSAWPTCPRDPADVSESRYPNGCPVSWLRAGFGEPTCTAETSADPNSGACTFDCRERRPDASLVFSAYRASECIRLGGGCSESQPQCMP